MVPGFVFGQRGEKIGYVWDEQLRVAYVLWIQVVLSEYYNLISRSCFFRQMGGYFLHDSTISLLRQTRILLLGRRTHLRHFRILLAYEILSARKFLRDFLEFFRDFLRVRPVAFVAIDELRATDFLHVVERLLFGTCCVGAADSPS